MTRHARKVVTVVRTVGIGLALAWLVRRACAALYVRRRELLLLKRLKPGTTAREADGLRIERATPAHEALLRAFNARYRTPQKVGACAAYLRNGYEGFLAFLDGDLVGYWWWVTEATDPALTHPCVERFGVTLDGGEVFAFDYFVTSECRNRGIGVTFLRAIYAELAREGYRAVWGSVDADNVAARWVYKLVGNTVARESVSHELAWFFLLQDRRVYVRNTRWNRTHPFERRLLFARRRPTASPSRARHNPDIAPEGLSPRGV